MREYVKLLENAESMHTVYHGSPTSITQFTLDHMGDGHDEYGPGIYFALNEKIAKHYGQYVHRVTLDGSLNLMPDRAPDIEDARALMKASPELEDRLTDWEENPDKAFQMALRAMTNQDSYAEMIDNIWYDFYRGNEKIYLENVVRITGYHGKMVTPDEEGEERFLVLYDPSKIVDVSY